MHCINVSHPDYQELLKSSGINASVLNAKISVWMDKNGTDNFPSLEQLNITPQTVNATLKIVDALEKLQRGVFTQDKLQGWLNDLQKQGVSNQQLELFKKIAKPGMTKGEIAASIAADYSYTVEINTTKTQTPTRKLTEAEDAALEFLDLEELGIDRTDVNTNYYSNLTVPGGTNYTEQEIATPDIIPNIQGHAEFATDKGIGWFRSDDKTVDALKGNWIKSESELPNEFIYSGERYFKESGEWQTKSRFIEDIETVIWRYNMSLGNERIQNKPQEKTRRILEVQSDLFQKGREKLMLTETLKEGYKFTTDKGNFEVTHTNATFIEYKKIGEEKEYRINTDKFQEIIKEKTGKDISPLNSNENQFLQLLNKDNNWVTFFVKSIIQDSAKKGYEKVLFPSGNTASKVEGHSTLEEFKKQKEDRIKELESRVEFLKSTDHINKIGDSYKNSLTEGKVITIESESQLQNIFEFRKKEKERLENTNNEIAQLKQELERVEGPEGFAALKPIYNFYENTVTNILRKQGFSPKVITDEYGNTWNEVEVKKETASTPVFYQKKLNIYQQQAEDIYWDHVYGQTLTEEKIDAINKALQSISRRIGDTDWTLRLSKNNKYYIAGYKNMAVTSADYYSPYANGMFRQLESTSKEGPIGELTDKLYKWAKTHGISIEAMDTLMERFAERYQDGALGVADFANALIGIADGAKIDTLPEEIAHFAIEIMINDPSVIRALEAVKLTPQYAAVKEAYKDTYNNEIDFQKEALGKLLAQALISEFKTPTDITKEEQGFWAYLKSVKDRFVNWVKSKFSKSEAARQDLDNAILPLAKAILDGQYLGELIEENYMPEGAQKMMYSLEDNPEPEPVPDPIIENKKKFVQEVIIQLGDRMSMLKRSAKSQVSIAAIEKEIQLLEYKLAKGELDLAISSFVKLAEGEIDMIYTALKKAQNSGLPNPTTLVLSENFMQMYENIFRNFLKEMYDAKAPLEETEELRKLIHNLSITIQDARGINQVLMKNISRRVLEEANTDPYGNIIDPDFDAGAVSEDTHEDVSTWRLLVGNYKYADSKIIKAAHKIIFDSIAVVKRFATRTGNDLLSAQETMLKSGGKIEDLIEKNEDGSNSHYFIREYKWADYYKKMEEAKQKIAEELGFENYNQIQIVFLNPDQLKVYTTGWKNFYNENTKKFSYQNESGDVVTKKVPNDSYRNARFDEVMSNPATKAYYDLLIKTKKQALDKMPVQYRTEKMIFMVPPILKSTIDRLTNKDESFITRVSKLAREALFIEQDETQFGQLNVLNNKMVPIHFIRPLSNISDLSYDVARSVTLFAEMAENFREMNKISGDLGTLQYTLAERNYFTDNKRTQRKKGIESKEYEALEVLLDAHVFGIERKALASEPLPENKITKALGIDGKQFSWTKASQRFATFIRNNNLAFNFITSTSGWLKGSGDSVIEDAIGIYTTQESKMWARGEFFSNLFQVIGEVGKPKQTNKMHLILQEAGVVELEKMLYETTKNRATRKLLNRDIMYTTFATGDYGIKGRITLAIYDNYRLYNNQFMTRARFYEKTAKEKGVENDGKHQKEVSKQWSELREKSLYNAHDVVDGKLIIKPEYEKYATENLLNSVKGKVESVATYVDGTMSKTDKGKLARTIAGDFLLMHRGWFIGLVDTRFRKEGTNLITEEEEIGTYRATSSFLYTAFYKTLIKDKAGLSAAFGTWNTLSPAKKRGVMKTGLDLLYLTLVSFVSALANIAADDADDDDWTTQYMAYQLNRLLLEQGAAWSPAELVNMIDEPVVGARMIKDLLDLGEMFNFHDVYESGMYEDKYHATKWWMKKLPTRNIYEMQFPELKNRFIKQMVDSKIYEAMSDDQAKSVTGSSWFKDWILPKGVLSDSDTQKENIQYIMNDLEEDSEEDNGFN